MFYSHEAVNALHGSGGHKWNPVAFGNTQKYYSSSKMSYFYPGQVLPTCIDQSMNDANLLQLEPPASGWSLSKTSQELVRTWFSLKVFNLATWPLEMVDARTRNSATLVVGVAVGVSDVVGVSGVTLLTSLMSSATSFCSNTSSLGIWNSSSYHKCVRCIWVLVLRHSKSIRLQLNDLKESDLQFCNYPRMYRG